MDKYESIVVNMTKEAIKAYAEAVSTIADDAEKCTTYTEIRDYLMAIRDEFYRFENMIITE